MGGGLLYGCRTESIGSLISLPYNMKNGLNCVDCVQGVGRYIASEFQEEYQANLLVALYSKLSVLAIFKHLHSVIPFVIG